jgi:hypothetical protein
MPRALRWHADLIEISAARLEVPFAATWWRGCLDLAIQLRGYEAFLADTMERPAFVHELLDWLVISLHPNDVLCASGSEMRARLSSIVDACRGRSITIGTSGLTPLSADIGEFVRRLRSWSRIARSFTG